MQKNRRRRYHRHPGKKAEVKIISIGNITSGGSGKTPFTIFLANYLQNKGKKIAVSHRGYKGSYEYDNRIISDRTSCLPAAQNAGDEAQLLAEKLPGIPVCTGKDRWKSIELLCKTFPDLDIIILDDSYQHLQVQHDLDIVIFKMPRPLGNGLLLPAGILREPLSALHDADIIIINGEGEIPHFVNKFAAQVFQGKYHNAGFFLNNQRPVDINKLKKSKLGIVSGIAQPQSLEASIIQQHLNWEFHLKFADHYDYTNEDKLQIDRVCRQHQVQYLITTEKDYTKLKELNLKTPAAVFRIEFQIDSNQFELSSFLQ